MLSSLLQSSLERVSTACCCFVLEKTCSFQVSLLAAVPVCCLLSWILISWMGILNIHVPWSGFLLSITRWLAWLYLLAFKFSPATVFLWLFLDLHWLCNDWPLKHFIVTSTALNCHISSTQYIALKFSVDAPMNQLVHDQNISLQEKKSACLWRLMMHAENIVVFSPNFCLIL